MYSLLYTQRFYNFCELSNHTRINIREHFHAKSIFLFFAQSENFKCVAKCSFLRDFEIGAWVMDLSVNVLRPRRSSLAARYLPASFPYRITYEKKFQVWFGRGGVQV